MIKPKKPKKEKYPIDETVLKYLRTGEEPERGTLGWDLSTSRFFDDGELIRKVIEEYKHLLK